MTIEELEEQIDLLSLIESSYPVKKVGSNTYRVETCPVCNSKDHFTIYPDTNSYSSFSDCCIGGSVYKYLMEVERMDKEQAYKELTRLAGEDVIEHKKSPITSQPTKAKEDIEPINYTNLINQLYNEQTEKDKQYFINRGLTYEVIEKYKLCIGDIKKLEPTYYGKRAIIPIWKNGKAISWNSRALNDKDRKYMKPTGKATMFNIDYIHTLPSNSTLILTEGEFDSLSLESIGIKSIALGGVGNYEKFINNLDRNDLTILTAFDNDKVELNSKQYIKIPDKYNDINEWLIGNKEEFKVSVYNQLETMKRPDNLYNYMSNNFMQDIESYSKFKDRKTGFSNLDEITSLYPGLYVLGGLSTLGKTTFIHQMADQMAEMGEHILFFSLEMATLELMTKSIARLSVLNDNGSYNLSNGVSALDVRLRDTNKKQQQSISKAIKNYEPISKRFNIIEGNFNTDITQIKNYVRQYIKKNDVQPVVIVDYLQIIPDNSDSWSNKDKIDKIVTTLKQLSRDYNIAVIVVSSFNRTNYLTPVGFESFKESGGIEYSADVVWGLQLQAIHDSIFSSKEKIADKRKVIDEAKSRNPRQIELVALKNRNGKSNYRCNFTYYPKYDLFIPEDNPSYKAGYSVNVNQTSRKRL